MTKEEQLIDELSKMPPMVIATAYLYAINYTRYGVDVTKDWVTATQNASALEKAYIEGYHDALQRRAESEENEIHCDYTDEEIAKSFIEDVEAVKDLLPMGESEES